MITLRVEPFFYAHLHSITKKTSMLPDIHFYQTICHSIEEGVIIINEDGEIEWVNRSLERMFAYDQDELLGKTLEILLPRGSKERHKTLRFDYTSNPAQRPISNAKEFEGVTKDGRSIWVRIGLNFHEEQGKLYSLATVSDKTEKISAERSMKKYARQAQLFFDLSTAIFLELDKDGCILLINNAGCQLLESTEEELLGKNWFSTFINKVDRPIIKKIFGSLMAGNITESQSFSSEIVTKSGKSKLIQWQNTVVKNNKGEIKGTLSSGVDISAQQELEKKQTEAILIGAEKERKRIAIELHDGIVQALSAVSMNLKSLEDNILTLSEDNQKAYNDALDLVIDTIADTRAISHDLMPTVILKTGLVKALEDLAVRTAKYHGIDVRIDPDHVDYGLNEMQRLNIYRIIQELTQNTIKHANATSLEIKIRKVKNEIVIVVADDGNGFDDLLENIEQRGIGLRNIDIRVKALNGELSISSAKQKGTIVEITIPVRY